MDIKQDALKITAERPEARIHHEETIRQTTHEDAGRDHQVEQGEGEETREESREEVKTLDPDDPEGEDDDTFLFHRDDSE